MSNRLDKERQAKLEPKRMDIAMQELKRLGFNPETMGETCINFTNTDGNVITYYPYSGWATGRGIEDGRGLKKLLAQLQPKTAEPVQFVSWLMENCTLGAGNIWSLNQDAEDYTVERLYELFKKG